MKILPNSLIQFIQRSKKTILLIIIVSAATLLISTMVSIWLNSFQNLHVPSFGTIQIIGAEAYGGNLTIQDGKQIIDWGTVYPGAFITRSFYIQSKSNVPVTLNLTISNITFQNSTDQNVTGTFIENPLNLTWDYNNVLLNPNDEIYVTLTLQISSEQPFIDFLINNGVKEFSFDIVIMAVEQ